MSENLLYYLDKNKVPKKEQEKAVKATAEWLESRKTWFSRETINADGQNIA